MNACVRVYRAGKPQSLFATTVGKSVSSEKLDTAGEADKNESGGGFEDVKADSRDVEGESESEMRRRQL